MIHEFGEFELDARRRVLTSRADGQPVEITGRVMDALIYLVERPSQLIEKRALIEALWPNVVVEEGNLSQTIHTLRRVLGEKAGEHRYIATVPGRGYQFVAETRSRAADVAAGPPVAPPAPAASEAQRAAAALPMPPETSRRRLLIAGGLIALLVGIVVALSWRGSARTPALAAVDAHPSIAVLPFVDMSEEQDQGHFAEGLSDEILNILAHADHLRVIARTSSFSFKDENADIKTIAQRLEVTHVLEGSVRKAGDRLRITAQLIDAASSAHVWSETYDRDVHDIFGVQREIAVAVADALRVTLARNRPRPAETTSPDAYEHYLQARHLFNRRAPGDLVQAKAHLDQALRIDPGYARAWSALAGVYFVAPFEKVQFPDAIRNWGDAAKKAIALGPDLAEANIRASQYFMYTRDKEAAFAAFDRAKALDPQDPMVLGILQSDAIVEGRLEDAVEIQRQMVATDPLSASQRGNLGFFLMRIGRLQEAQAQFERAMELSPAGLQTLTGLSDVLILQGRIDEAFDVIARIPEGYLRDQRLALVEAARGDTKRSDEILARMAALTQEADFDTGVAFAIAEVNARRNAPDLAFEWLERAQPRSKRQRTARPYWAMVEDLQVSAYLTNLHEDPRWPKLIAQVKSRLWQPELGDTRTR